MITVRADSSCIFLSDITSLKGYVEWVRENQASVILNNQRFLLSLRPCSKEYRVVDVRGYNTGSFFTMAAIYPVCMLHSLIFSAKNL